MKRITCPLNGPRDAAEFVQGPAWKRLPAPDADDAAWAAWVFLEENRKGVVREWWCHVPTNTWFLADRDTATDTILRTLDPGELEP
jgi:sarcosine oxidase subunit delta